MKTSRKGDPGRFKMASPRKGRLKLKLVRTIRLSDWKIDVTWLEYSVLIGWWINDAISGVVMTFWHLGANSICFVIRWQLNFIAIKCGGALSTSTGYTLNWWLWNHRLVMKLMMCSCDTSDLRSNHLYKHVNIRCNNLNC